MSIIQRLADIRNAAGMTQSKLASELGTTQQTINKYENGDRDIAISKVMHIADYFKVSLDYLMGVSEFCEVAEPKCSESVSKRLGDCRMQKRLSQKELAELLDTSQQQIGKYETGKQEITSRRFIKYAEVCGVSLDYLAGRTYDPTRR